MPEEPNLLRWTGITPYAIQDSLGPCGVFKKLLELFKIVWFRIADEEVPQPSLAPGLTIE